MEQVLFSHIEGKGEPIVLLHGYMASSHYFKALRRRLSQTHQVISLDLLGFGRSPKPRTAYTYEIEVEAVHHTLQTLGLSSFVLIGHSLGALIALRYAITYPHKVRRLGLFNPPMFASTEEALATHKTTGLHYRIALHSPIRDVLWYASKILPRYPGKRRLAVNLTDMLRASAHARRDAYQNIILKAAFFRDSKKLTVRTLVVTGKYDRGIYLKNTAKWQPQKNVHLLMVDTGHHTPWRHPDITEDLIRAHLLQ